MHLLAANVDSVTQLAGTLGLTEVQLFIQPQNFLSTYYVVATQLLMNKIGQFLGYRDIKEENYNTLKFFKCITLLFHFIKTCFPSLTPIFSGKMVSACFLCSPPSGDALKFQNVLTVTLLCYVSALHINLKLPLSLGAHMKGFSVASSTKEINCAPAQHLWVGFACGIPPCL